MLEADGAVTGIETRERRMREPPDELVPWMLLLEGTSPAALEQAWQQARSRVAPECAARAGIGVYAVQTVFALCDL